jgi:hypothetical protein
MDNLLYCIYLTCLSFDNDSHTECIAMCYVPDVISIPIDVEECIQKYVLFC